MRSILATAGEGVISPLDKVMQRLTVEVCGFPSYFSIVIAAHIEPDNAGISSTERFVEFWEDNIRGRDRSVARSPFLCLSEEAVALTWCVDAGWSASGT